MSTRQAPLKYLAADSTNILSVGRPTKLLPEARFSVEYLEKVKIVETQYFNLSADRALP